MLTKAIKLKKPKRIKHHNSKNFVGAWLQKYEDSWACDQHAY